MVKINFATLFYRNKSLLYLSIIIILVGGISAWTGLPREEDPRITNRFAMVLTPYPGALATRVEALVSEPIEQKLRRSPEIKTLRSISLPGFSAVTIELKHSITDVEPVWSRLRDYVAAARLPVGAGTPQLDDTRSYSYTRILAFEVAPYSTSNLLTVRRYVKELASRLRAIKGTDKVEVFGEPREEVLITIDPQALANLGLTMERLAKTIQAADAKVSAGALMNSKHQMLVEVSGGFNLLKRLRELPIQSNHDSIVHLHDIATVDYAIEKPLNELAFVDKKRAILLAVRMLGKKHINQWGAKVDEHLKVFSQDLPKFIQLKTVFDQRAYTNKRFSELQRNIVIALVSIILVLFFTLGWRSALIVGFTLPLTMLFTLFAISLIGLSLDQMTVIGLIVALGIMIDNAIVITEGVQHRRLQGYGALKSVAVTVRHFWLPLLGATITTVLAFLPIVLLPGPTGEFVGGIGYSVIFTLIGSYFIAHTIIASLAGRFVLPNKEASWYQIGVQLPRVAAIFNRLLVKCLCHVKLSTLALVAIILIGIIARMGLTEQFFPVSGRDQINIEVQGSPANDIRKTQELVTKLEKLIASHPQVKQQVWSVGTNVPPFYYNILHAEQNNAMFAQAMITLKHANNIDKLIESLQQTVDKQVLDATVLVKKIDQGPPFDAPVEIRVYGQDLSRLQFLGDEVRRRLAQLPMITHTLASIKTGMPKLLIELDEQQVHELGLSSQNLAKRLRYFIDGVAAGSVLEGTELIPVKLRLALGDREQMSQLLELPLSVVVNNKRYQATPLSAVASFSLKPEWRNISRRNGWRVNSIYGYLKAGVLPAEALKEWKKSLEEDPIKLPPGYFLEVGGEKEKRDESVERLLLYLPVIFILLFSVLFLTFQDVRTVIILLVTVVLAASMGLLSLFISGYPFGFQVVIALIGLIGLAINAAIVILSEIRANPAAKKGDIMAIIDSVNLCLRHIVSTTLTTVVGFLPLIISGGQFWPPFAYVLAGGTLLTTSISLIGVPVLYHFLYQKAP